MLIVTARYVCWTVAYQEENASPLLRVPSLNDVKSQGLLTTYYIILHIWLNWDFSIPISWVNEKRKCLTIKFTNYFHLGFGGSTGCSSKSLTGYSHSPPKIYQWIGTYMQTMGSPGKLLCNTQGKHKTTWVAPNEKQIVSGQKYKVGLV